MGGSVGQVIKGGVIDFLSFMSSSHHERQLLNLHICTHVNSLSEGGILYEHEVTCNGSCQAQLSEGISVLFGHYESNRSLAKTSASQTIESKFRTEGHWNLGHQYITRKEIKTQQKEQPCSETSCDHKRWEIIYRNDLFNHKRKHELEWHCFHRTFPLRNSRG